MSEPHEFDRSPELMSAADTALLVVDVQEKLIPAIRDHQRVVWNIRRLIDGAGVLGVQVLATEQYPKGLGGTVGELATLLGDVPEKLSFSCCGCEETARQLESTGVHRVLVVGIESHVCVQQTVFDLMAAGYHVYVAVDAVGSRAAIDHETAIRRIDSGGATVTTTEAALFEWCREAGTPEFKQISALVRENAPEA
jgi:nicotinamidase-related amidase